MGDTDALEQQYWDWKLGVLVIAVGSYHKSQVIEAVEPGREKSL